MRLDVRRRSPLLEARGAGVVTRVGTPDDLDAVLELDAASFDPFWAFDREMLAHYIAAERLGVAQRGDEVVGYTLCTVRRGEGSLGRLAVRPDLQGHGIGAILLEDAVAFLEREGVRQVTLCTQAENARSRRLYRNAGFTEAPGLLLGLMSGEL